MASYSSYKQITNAQVVDGSVPSSALASGAFSNWNVKWVFGSPNSCSQHAELGAEINVEAPR